MKKPATADTVYHKLYSRPKQTDPASWAQHVQRNLVPEVREEVQRYFGRIDCLEAQYPGLDYTYGPHRRRLASFTWHRRLFRAFDELRLTSEEILTLCNWEGTRAAKERFERESQTKIENTTLDGVEPSVQLVESNGPRAVLHNRPDPMVEAVLRPWLGSENGEQAGEDEDQESIGIHLNQNLIAAAEARERGEIAQFDVQWERWMKEAIERNEDTETILQALRQGRPFPSSMSDRGSEVHLPVIDGIDPAEASSSAIPGPQFQRFRDAVEELGPSSARLATETSELLNGQSSSSRAPTRSSTDHARLTNLVEELHTNNTRMQAENSAIQNFLSRTRTETAR